MITTLFNTLKVIKNLTYNKLLNIYVLKCKYKTLQTTIKIMLDLTHVLKHTLNFYVGKYKNKPEFTFYNKIVFEKYLDNLHYLGVSFDDLNELVVLERELNNIKFFQNNENVENTIILLVKIVKKLLSIYDFLNKEEIVNNKTIEVIKYIFSNKISSFSYMFNITLNKVI